MQSVVRLLPMDRVCRLAPQPSHDDATLAPVTVKYVSLTQSRHTEALETLLNLPVSQSTQASLPTVFLYLPTGQAITLTVPCGAVNPMLASQPSEELVPNALCLSGPHSRQNDEFDAAIVSENLEAEHDMQAEADTISEYRPALHDWQAALPMAALNFPNSQAVLALAPSTSLP
jgi:hypothetical protein